MLGPPMPVMPTPMPVMPTPVVFDVTPHSLCVATVGGYCERLIERNTRTPTSNARVFTTSRDGQEIVRLRVCQGESRRFEENMVLGEVVLENLVSRPRGQTGIEVTFQIDASGLLNVCAVDQTTGQKQLVSLSIRGAPSPAEIEASRQKLLGLVQEERS
jgi:molecular chaperone DnaK